MEIRELKRRAGQAVKASPQGLRRQVWRHSAISAAVWLLIIVIGVVISVLGTEGGLDRMGTQALLSTAQVALRAICILVLPFWGAGVVYAALEPEEEGNWVLTEGVRRGKPILVTWLWRIVNYAIAGFAGVWIIRIVLSLLALPEQAGEIWRQFCQSLIIPTDTEGRIVLAMYAVCFLTGILVFALPVFYRYRLVIYQIMDNPEIGGMEAMRQGGMLMRRKGSALIRLDLSYWWYYLLELAALGMMLMDVLPALGIPAGNMPWVWGVAGVALRFGLQIMARPKLCAAYGLLYRQLCTEEPEKKAETPKKPEKMPWKY